jgi:DinB superfamily
MALGARPGVKTVFQQAPNGLAAQTGAICRGAERGAQLMQKPLADEYAAGYQKYFDLVPEGDYLTLLRKNSLETIAFFEKIPNETLEYRYSDGKWTIKEVFMHIVDTERVFSYRGLAADRGEEDKNHRQAKGDHPMKLFKRAEDGPYWYRFRFQGRRIEKSTGVRRKSDAETIAAAYRTQLAKGEVGLDPPPELSEQPLIPTLARR